MNALVCRFCGAPLTQTFVDLGKSPLANSFLDQSQMTEVEPFFPLRALVCTTCFLVQLQDFEKPETLFNDHYAYFSSYSETWLRHARDYVEKMTERLKLNSNSLVIEIASNDGYLLQYFVEKKIPALGVEPAANVAAEAKKKGVPSLEKFFGKQTADALVADGKKADLLLGNNVLAHVPDINDFVSGIKIVLKFDGVVTMEFPHLLKLIEGNQYDTVYHEHFSYLSFHAVEKIFSAHGLALFDVEELPTHGGSLRVFGRHKENEKLPVTERVTKLKKEEHAAGILSIELYKNFGEKVESHRQEVRDFLVRAKKESKRIVGYGAPAKGNTLLNFCGVGPDFIEYTVDRSPHKQGRYLPGVHIPIESPEKIHATRPDYIVILPWNIKDEIMEQMSSVREWGAKFVTFIPEVRTFS